MARHSKVSRNAWLPPPAGRSLSRRPRSPTGSAAVQALWDAVAAIPRGQAATYGTVARAAGLPGRARLAGFALKTAPADMHLPWHRVVGAGGRIAFPPASRQHREQQCRLRAEGVVVRNGRVSKDFLPDRDGL